jgi:outer membrane lipoprotein-sorting protein
MARRWSHWAPAVVAPVLVAAGSFAVASGAGAAVDLPDRSPAEVLALIAGSTEDSFSGTFEQRSELGIPALPEGLAGSDSDDLAAALDLLTGSHTARVFAAGPDIARLQVLDRLGERDVVRNGRDVWLWDSAENAAVHVTLPADTGHGRAADQAPSPTELADELLAKVGATSELSVGRDGEVAGRPAYELVLTPRTPDTLVGSVAIAVDAETGLGLGVTVHARGQDAPAFRAAWTSLDLAAPDPALFDFTPPPGASVEEKAAPGDDGQRPDVPAEDVPTVVGSGWDAVVVLPAGAEPAGLTSSPLLAALTREVDGGRLLSSALLTALVTDDGRVLVGAVPPARLQAVAAAQ